MSQGDLTVHLSPYVAAAIIEHAKRRNVAAGYLLGERTATEVRVLDFYPLTHAQNLADVRSPQYMAQRDKRMHAKRAFTSQHVLGWYSGGVCPEDVPANLFEEWTQEPHKLMKSRFSIHVHCALPEDGKISVRWSASLISVKPAAAESGKNKHAVTMTVESHPAVVISAMQHAATNVFLSHVASLGLYGGKSTQAVSNLLNLDLIAFENAKLPAPPMAPAQPGQKDEPLPQRPMEVTLIEVNAKLQAAIKRAKTVAASSGGNSSAAAEEKRESEELLASLEAIRATKAVELGQQVNAASRDDVSTQRFKDAIMIKCMAVMLRREVKQIEYLARQYQDGQNRPGNAGGGNTTNNTGGGGIGNRNRNYSNVANPNSGINNRMAA